MDWKTREELLKRENNQGIDSPQQPVFSYPSSHNARPTVSLSNNTTNLYFPTSIHGPATQIMAGDGPLGLCTDFHTRAQQPGSSSSSPKSDTSCRNCNRGNAIWHGSLCSIPMIYDPNTSTIVHQASTSQLPHWSYPMHHPPPHVNPNMNLLPFYTPHYWGPIYALWFQPINSFNPLSPYSPHPACTTH